MSREFPTLEDRQVINSRGITEETIAAQLALFRKGTPWIKLHRPCTVGDGIVILRTDEMEVLSRRYAEAVATGRVMKFVPASGAASRMFQGLLQQFETVPIPPDDEDMTSSQFLTELHRFAFFDDLEAALRVEGLDIQTCIAQRQIHKILGHLLTSRGLNYANLPKALIKFHRYAAGYCRTPLEEHVVDAAEHTLDRDNVVRVHFAISAGCEAEISNAIEEMQERYKATGIQYRITLSHQHASTDTIAVDTDNRPFRDRHHRLLFRPGGHGALLENLQTIQADIVHLNNIDNVVHGRLKDDTDTYKRALGGYLVTLQNQIFTHLRRLAAGQVSSRQIERIFTFAKENLSLSIPKEILGQYPSNPNFYLRSSTDRFASAVW